jgi:hypothetical protein
MLKTEREREKNTEKPKIEKLPTEDTERGKG